MIELTLPVPPSVNNYRTPVRRGQTVMTQAARDYKELVRWQLLTEEIEPLKGDLSVTIVWYRARKSGDLQNRFKIVFDALEGYCYQDDKQIAEIHARRDDSQRDNPRLTILLQTII